MIGTRMTMAATVLMIVPPGTHIGLRETPVRQTYTVGATRVAPGMARTTPTA